MPGIIQELFFRESRLFVQHPFQSCRKGKSGFLCCCCCCFNAQAGFDPSISCSAGWPRLGCLILSPLGGHISAASLWDRCLPTARQQSGMEQGARVPHRSLWSWILAWCPSRGGEAPGPGCRCSPLAVCQQLPAIHLSIPASLPASLPHRLPGNPGRSLPEPPGAGRG